MTPSLRAIHDNHAERVWRNLHRMGVRDADLPDMLQEVFMIVHRRRSSFDGTSKIETWLYGICRRVAANYRRRAHVRRERPISVLPERAHDETPEATAIAQDRERLLGVLLDTLDVDRRVVLVMYELEELSCAEIAEQLGIPVGTVYSRLHHGRTALKEAWVREKARQEHATRKRGAA